MNCSPTFPSPASFAAPVAGARLTTFAGLLPKPADVGDYHYTIVHEMLEDLAANGTPLGDVLDPAQIAAHLECLKEWASELQRQVFAYAASVTPSTEQGPVASAA